MPNLSAEEYRELEALSRDPEVDENVRASAMEAVGQFRAQFEDELNPGAADTFFAGKAEPPGAEQPPDLTLQLDPNFSLIAQADATAPATTHPGGDQAAASEWEAGTPDGELMIVYEPPVETVRQKLLENPAMVKALWPHVQPSPEEIASLERGGDIYDAYANRVWSDTANAAAGAGKRVYRYSKAPFLQSGKLVSTMERLGGFTNAALPSFIMGVDDTALFGAGRAGNATDPENLAAQQVADTNAPGAQQLGQALGLLTPWGATARLYQFIGSGGAKLAARAGTGALGLAARTAAAAGSAAAAGGLDRLAREGVQSAASEGPRPIDWGNVGEATTDPLNIGLGAAGEVVGSGARALAQHTRHNTAGGAIGRMEAQGIKFRPVLGPTRSKQYDEAVEGGRAHDTFGEGPLAKELAPKLEEGLDLMRSDVTSAIAAKNRPFFESPEGQMPLPVTSVLETAVDGLRQLHQGKGAGLRPIGDSGEAVNLFRDALRANIGEITFRKTDGAIKLTLDEARAFLPRGTLPDKTRPEHRRVYLIPTQLNAEQTEKLIESYKRRVDNTGADATPIERHRTALRDAAYKDRQARPMDGTPGAWSESQGQAKQSLDEVEAIEKRVGRGDRAFQSAVQHAHMRPGELLQKEALQAAAKRAGVKEQLDAIRALDPQRQLSTYLSAGGDTASRTGLMTRAARQANVRGAYPIAHALEGPLGPIRGGTAGRFNLLQGNRLAMPAPEEEPKR